MFGRVLRTGLSSLRDRAAARLAALRFNSSREGYWVISYYRCTAAHLGPTEYVEKERKWYRWKWRAEQAAWPRLFSAKVGPGEYGIILTRVVPGKR